MIVICLCLLTNETKLAKARLEKFDKGKALKNQLTEPTIH